MLLETEHNFCGNYKVSGLGEYVRAFTTHWPTEPLPYKLMLSGTDDYCLMFGANSTEECAAELLRLIANQPITDDDVDNYEFNG